MFILPVVIAVAVIGSVRPALLAVAVGFLAGVYLHFRSYGRLRQDLPVDTVKLTAFVLVGATIALLIDELTRATREQAALRRVATLVARGAPPDRLFAAVTEEVGRLLNVDFSGMGRYEPDETVTIVAWYGIETNASVRRAVDTSAGRTSARPLRRRAAPPGTTATPSVRRDRGRHCATRACALRSGHRSSSRDDSGG